MKSSGLFVSAVVLGAALLFTGAASGQTPVLEADCTQDARCSALKEQAAERSKSGDLGEALRLYKLAHEVRPDPRLLFNIARLLHKQGKSVEAVPYYQEFIDAPIQDEEQRQKAREYLEQIQAARATTEKLQAGKPSSYATNTVSADVARINARPPGEPIYKKWWFWTIIGGVIAAGAVAGVAGGVTFSNQLPGPVIRPF